MSFERKRDISETLRKYGPYILLMRVSDHLWSDRRWDIVDRAVARTVLRGLWLAQLFEAEMRKGRNHE
jgi:hypothetical protein